MQGYNKSETDFRINRLNIEITACYLGKREVKYEEIE